MKKVLFALLICFMMIFCACSSQKQSDQETGPAPESTRMAEILDQKEYNLYFDIFYQQKGQAYEGEWFSKNGIFTTLKDSYNNVDRYYVWGYADSAKNNDWQWEIDPDGLEALPHNGSRVQVSGVFEQNQTKALDGYWLTDAALALVQGYNPTYSVDLDLTTMSTSLARVQILHMQNAAEKFDGVTLRLFGRLLGADFIQHPYQDDVWTLPIAYEGAAPQSGELATVQGRLQQIGQEQRLKISQAAFVK